MKRTAALLLALMFAVPLKSLAQETKKDSSSPPYWMFSYDEFQDLRDVQKKVYLNELLGRARKLPSLSSLRKADLDETATWEESWNALMAKVDEDCANKSNATICRGLEETRFDVLDSFGNQKIENRAALDVERERRGRRRE